MAVIPVPALISDVDTLASTAASRAGEDAASLSASSDGVDTQDSEGYHSPSAVDEPDYTFDPAIHLAPLEKSIKYIMMTDMGYQPSLYSPVAATKPVPFFTPEAVRRIRAEVFDHETLATHLYSDTNSPCVVRGHCPKRAKFTYNALTHPEVQKRVNLMAGVDLTHVYDYELGHTFVSILFVATLSEIKLRNIQLGPRGWSGLKAEPDLVTSEGEMATTTEISPTLFRGLNWHMDSYPVGLYS